VRGTGIVKPVRRFLLHVLPDRFVRIRYYGLLANRHREQSLALCREVLPGPPVPPKLTKSDWQSLLKSLTGVDPMSCEVCGHNALHPSGNWRPLGHQGLHLDDPVAHSFIQIFIAQPWSGTLCTSAGPYGIIASTKSWSGAWACGRSLRWTVL